MKNIKIKTLKTTLIVIDMPENFTEVHLSDKTRYADGKGNRLTLHVQHRKRLEGEDLHTWLSEQHSRHIFDGEGEYKLLGHPSELTEEDWKGIVGTVKDTPHGDTDQLVDRFENYAKHGYLSCNSATESGLSLLKANGVVMENCFGEKPDSNDDYYRDAMGITDEFYKALAEWNKAQSKVWLNPQIFVKL